MQPKFFFTFISHCFLSNNIWASIFLHYQENGQDIQHRILMDEEYYVETQFITNSNQFIKTIGVFTKKRGMTLWLPWSSIPIFQKTV